MSDWLFWVLISCFLLLQAKNFYHDYLKYKTDMLYIEDSRKALTIMLEKNRETNDQINRLIEILGSRQQND